MPQNKINVVPLMCWTHGTYVHSSLQNQTYADITGRSEHFSVHAMGGLEVQGRCDATLVPSGWG